MGRRDRRDEYDDKRGIWEEADELADESSLPEKVGRRIRSAGHEMGEDMGEGMERMGGRLREWGDDAGLKVERAGRSERRWLEGNRQNADDDYDAALYDVDYAGPQRMRDRRQGAGGVRRKRIDKRLDRLEAKIHPERRHGRMEEDEEEERMGKWKKAEMKLREKERDSEGEGGWWSWWGGRKDKREDEEMKSRPHYQEKKFGADVDVVCVDSSKASEQAFRYALRNLPRQNTLMLIHGVYSPPGAIDSKLEEQKEMKRIEKRMMHLCDKKGRRCIFRNIEFATNDELGEKVCRIAERNHAGSVIVGKKAATSDLRRSLLGSPSVSVMQQCNVPVTLIAERKESSFE